MKKSFRIRMFLLTHSCERSGNLSLTNEMISDVLNLSQDDIEHLSSCRINNTLVINVRLKKKTCSCPNCGSFSIRIKEYKLRKIHHSLLSLDPCILNYQARRYICSDCGITFYEDNPFSNQGVNISNLTILNVLKELKEKGQIVTHRDLLNYLKAGDELGFQKAMTQHFALYSRILDNRKQLRI